MMREVDRPTPVWRDHLEHFKRRDRNQHGCRANRQQCGGFSSQLDLGEVADGIGTPVQAMERSVPDSGADHAAAVAHEQ